MFQSLIIAVALMIGTVARAEPVNLACSGDVRVTRPNGIVTEKYSLSVAVDVKAGMVKVEGERPVPILGDPNVGDNLVFAGKPDAANGIVMGRVNRVTGEASIDIKTLTDGVYKFYGSCKPTQRMF